MQRVRFHPPGRRCRIPGCITVLNHCNPGPECLLHRDRMAALGFEREGYARLWIAIEMTRAGLPAARAASSRIE
jgi:hypothetical protein